MSEESEPRPYDEWSTKPFDRAEDAAYVFGRDLMRYCRAEALKSAAPGRLPASADELREMMAGAVDSALCGVMDLLEGFFPMDAGPNYKVSYALSVCVAAPDGAAKERIDISPCMLDLPIGYWKWKEGEFR